MKPLPTSPKGRGTNCEKVKKESPSKLNGLYTLFVPGGQEPRRGRGTNCEKVKKESPSKLNGLYTPFVPGGQEPRRGGELIVEDKKSIK